MKKENFILLDELAKKYLEPDVLKSLPEVDIEVKKLDMQFDIEKLRFRLEANQISVATFLISLLILLGILLRG